MLMLLLSCGLICGRHTHTHTHMHTHTHTHTQHDGAITHTYDHYRTLLFI